MLYYTYTAVLKLAVGKVWQKKLAKEGVWNWLLVGRHQPTRSLFKSPLQGAIPLFFGILWD